MQKKKLNLLNTPVVQHGSACKVFKTDFIIKFRKKRKEEIHENYKKIFFYY
jgi:hypothetical protein